MEEVTIECVGDLRLKFGEGLSWDDRLNRLYFVDVFRSQLLWIEYGHVNAKSITLSSPPSVVVLTNRPGVVIASLETAFYLIDTADGSSEILAELPDRMNDAVVDFQGRLITGNQFFGPDWEKMTGDYWSYTKETSWEKIDSGKGNMNGPCFSPDGTILYVTDTAAKQINQFSYDQKTGSLSNGKVFADFQSIGGWPDGAKVDTDGGVWSAVFGASKLVRFTPDGKLNRAIELPTNNPTDIIFGGPDKNIAYITTVSSKNIENKYAGRLLRIENLGVNGLPEFRFPTQKNSIRTKRSAGV